MSSSSSPSSLSYRGRLPPPLPPPPPLLPAKAVWYAAPIRVRPTHASAISRSGDRGVRPWVPVAERRRRLFEDMLASPPLYYPHNSMGPRKLQAVQIKG